MNNSKNSTTRIAQNIKEVLTTIKAKECTVKRRLQTLKNSNIIVLAVVVLFLREIYSSTSEMVSSMLSVVEDYTISSPEIGDVEIHPDGNLNLMMSYVHTKSGHMMILRCLNTNIMMGHRSGMVTMHNQLNSGSTKYNTGEDMLNPILPYEGSVLEYIKEHHAVLLWLYDSNGMMSYNSKKDDLAHLFAVNSINEKRRNNYIEGDYKLMAALFLLSEGLKLPLKHECINDEPKITLYKYNEDEENTIFQINDIPWNNNKKNQSTRELINFLFEYCNSPVLEGAGFKDPTNYEEYATGNFIYTPGFLIRTYIYHYLNKIKRTEPKLFVNAVHDILRLYMPKKEQTSDKTDIQSKAEEIFKKLFMITSNSESDIKKKKRLMIRDIKNILEVNNFLYNPNSCNLAKKGPIQLAYILSADLSNRENDSFMRIALNDYMKYLSVHKKYNNEDENGIAKYIFELSKEQFETFSKNKLIGIKHCVPYAGIANQYDLAFLLIARAFRMNLKRTDPIMMLIKNLLANAYRKISVSINNEREYLVNYIAGFILETYIDGRPDITSILDWESLKTDEMLDKSIKKLKPISDILVYLSVKRADSALIKFIIAYRQMKNIYNNSHYIGELIEENMSKQEKIHLLQCLTKNGLANQVTSIVNKIKDTKEIKKSNDVRVALKLPNDLLGLLKVLENISNDYRDSIINDIRLFLPVDGYNEILEFDTAPK